MRNLKLVLWLAVIQMVWVSCSARTASDDLILVGSKRISSEQVALSYRFNPFLFKIKDKNKAKRRIVSSLIAQQLLAIDADETGFCDSTIDKRIEAHFRESVIENFRTDSVEKTIQVNIGELKKEYLRSLQEIEITYYLLEAERKQKVNTKKLTWPIQDTVLENTVYSLKEGQESKPIRTGNGVFSIKVLQKNRLSNPTAQDFNNRKQALSDHIRRRKIRQEYTRLFHDQIEPLMGTIHRKAYDALSTLLAEKLTAHAKQPPRLFGSEKELPDKVVLEHGFLARKFQSRPIISFPSGQTWTIKKVLEALKYGPYVFNYSNPQSFKQSLNYNTELLLEHQALYEAAIKAGYGNDIRVQREAEMWDRYYKATAHRYQLLTRFGREDRRPKTDGTLTNVQQKRLEFIDKYLVDLLDEYKVSINREEFNGLNPKKTDMVLMKSHFAHRLVVPLVEPLNGLPAWQKEMAKLFHSYHIQ